MEGVATTILNTKTAKEVARELKTAIQFRACLATAVLHKARTRVKEEIRAKGDKVHHYSARQISEMAERYLAEPGHREVLMELVKPWVTAMIFKTQPRR